MLHCVCGVILTQCVISHGFRSVILMDRLLFMKLSWASVDEFDLSAVFGKMAF